MPASQGVLRHQATSRSERVESGDAGPRTSRLWGGADRTPDGETMSSWHEKLFEALRGRWEAPRTRRLIGWALTASFFVSIVCIELSRQGWMPTVLGQPLPTNHLAAISWVFTLLLIVEVLDLIFSLAESIANALGKQLEIFSLILVRKTFDELILRKMFVVPSFEIHGGVKGLFDLGPPACALKVCFGYGVCITRLAAFFHLRANADI